MNRESTKTSVSTERPLPEGWRWVRLGEVCEFLDSRRAPVNDAERQQRIVGKPRSALYPYYGANGQVGWIDDYLFDEPLILLAEDGGFFGSKDRAIAYKIEGKAWVNNHAHVLRPVSGVDFDFCLHTLSIRPDVGQMVTGNTRPKLNQEVAVQIPIPLPPLPEQQRIAAILNERMAAVEQARAAVQARLEAAKALPAAYLRALFNSPEAQQWPRKRLGEVALSVQNGIYKSAENYGHGHAFLRMYNVQNDSWHLSFKTLAQVELEGGEKETFGLKLGDLLISRVNSFELVGKCAWVGPEAEGYVFENMLIRVRLGESVDSLFVAQQMRIRAVREQIEKIAKRAIGQASINSKDLRDIQIALPSLSIQQRIAARISEQIAAVERICKALEEELATISTLPASLLRRAFAGGL